MLCSREIRTFRRSCVIVSLEVMLMMFPSPWFFRKGLIIFLSWQNDSCYGSGLDPQFTLDKPAHFQYPHTLLFCTKQHDRKQPSLRSVLAWVVGSMEAFCPQFLIHIQTCIYILFQFLVYNIVPAPKWWNRNVHSATVTIFAVSYHSRQIIWQKSQSRGNRQRTWRIRRLFGLMPHCFIIKLEDGVQERSLFDRQKIKYAASFTPDSYSVLFSCSHYGMSVLVTHLTFPWMQEGSVQHRKWAQSFPCCCFTSLEPKHRTFEKATEMWLWNRRW